MYVHMYVYLNGQWSIQKILTEAIILHHYVLHGGFANLN